MGRGLRGLVMAVMLALPGHAAAEAPLLAPFDATGLMPAETRLLHAGLAALGDYDGGLDEPWDADGDRALAAWTGRVFGEAPRNLHAAALVMAFLREIDAAGWAMRALPDLGVSMALPEAVLAGPEPEASGRRWWGLPGTGLTLLAHRFGPGEAEAWHAGARAANAEPGALRDAQGPATMITAGTLADGRRFFTRSDRLAEHWATVFVAADPAAVPLMTLMRASLRPGTPEPWSLPEGGGLDAHVRAALALADRLEVAGSAPPQAVRLDDPHAPAASGTGFFVSDRVLVTAGHVVEGCAAIGLADGTRLTLIAEDPALDVAALHAPGAASAWLPLGPDAPARLGQRVHALGYPYYAIAGTALHLTGGNVSALAGVDDDRRFFSFTAPVQPGSSGGPLIGAHGGVLGVVVSRLSDSYIAEATGTLPQNVNYALGNGELAAFLARSGVAPAPAAPPPAYDVDADGLPPGLAAAVVPVLCL